MFETVKWRFQKKREKIFVRIIYGLLRRLSLMEAQKLFFYLESELDRIKKHLGLIQSIKWKKKIQVKIPTQPTYWFCPVCYKGDSPTASEPMATPEHRPHRGIDIGTCPGVMILLYSAEDIQAANEEENETS